MINAFRCCVLSCFGNCMSSCPSIPYPYFLDGEKSCMFQVEKMDDDDFRFAVQLANTMNWNMSSEDFEFMMKLEPHGCFVLFDDQERLGIATTVSFEKAGWFGNLVVTTDARREGAGNFLTKHAIDYLKNTGVETIGLYAYPHLVSFYERFGFVSDIDFLVLKGNSLFPATQGVLQPTRKRDVPKLIDFDRHWFGANRKKFLEPMLVKEGNLCFVSTENNMIKGYVAAKVYSKMAEVGPLICDTNFTEEALFLLKTMLSRLSSLEVFTCIPKKETALLNMLYKAGLKKEFRVVRMFLGPAIAKNCIYVAESLERG